MQIKDPSEAFQLAAVKQDGRSIQLIKNETLKILKQNILGRFKIFIFNKRTILDTLLNIARLAQLVER